MKTLHALIFNSDNLIFKIVDEVIETDESVTLTTYKPYDSNSLNTQIQELDEEGNTLPYVKEVGVIETPKEKRNFNIVSFKFNEETDKIISYNANGEEVPYEFQMTKELFHKLNNNSLYFINNQITTK
jgi:hypothetical protein